MQQIQGDSYPDRHLDLGSGDVPRNPYGRRELYGLDIRKIPDTERVRFVQADLNFEGIPFPDAHFSSLSAFDYLEHVPRLLETRVDGSPSTRLPFVDLMNEVWRVLVPGGRFYALTPCYPSVTAFQDPTHVNFITDYTHMYFCGSSPIARMYGFKGEFAPIRCQWVVHDQSLVARPLTAMQRIERAIKSRRRKLSHFLWELEAVKRS